MVLILEKGHDFLENWSLWERKIFQLAEIEAENRPSIRKLLYDFQACDASDDGNSVSSNFVQMISYIRLQHRITLS